MAVLNENIDKLILRNEFEKMNVLKFEDLKQRFWLPKEEARVIANFTRIHLLLLNKELKESLYNDEEIKELIDFVKKLDLCAICLEIDEFIFKHVKPLIDLEVDRVFFRCYSDERLFNSIDKKINDYEKYNSKITLK